MASFSDTAFSTSAFSTSGFSFAVVVPPAAEVIDFTGAFGGRQKQDRTVRKDLEKAVRFLMGEEETAEQVQELVQPYIAPRKTEAAPVRINWKAFQHDLHAVQNVLALYQQQVEQMALDEEDAEILLLL